MESSELISFISALILLATFASIGCDIVGVFRIPAAVATYYFLVSLLMVLFLDGIRMQYLR